jgi:oxygen-independent coproporphyrinogen-3 oxidase
VGSGALGEIGGLLYWNMPSMPAWRSAVQHGGLPVAEAWRPAAPQSRQRDAVEHLLCRLELPRGLCEDGLEAGWHRVAGRATDGLVRVVDDRLELTPKGRLSLPMLCRELAVSAAVARVQGLQ